MESLKMGMSPQEFADQYNVLLHIIRSVVSGINTVEVVKVEELNEETGTVAVMPIVLSQNASGEPIPESPIYDVKYLQWQYGENMIRAKPEVGDIGLILVCKKDISSITSGLVGSLREFSLSDGVYIGGLFGFNAEPTQYIDFTENGIEITTPKTLTVNAIEDVVVNAVNAEINASGKANITASEINLGGAGGKKVCLDGDEVLAGSTVIGTVKSSSMTTNSL